MNVFADAYSRYLAYNFNYINRTKLFQKYFKNSIVFITDPKFITKNFIDQIDKFPKYPYFFNPISKPPIGSFNIRKIYESSLDNTDKLLESMSDTPELAKKPLYDSIPVDINDFLEELCFQFSYTSKSIDALMVVPVVKIRIVRMFMCQGLMSMFVQVPFSAGYIFIFM